MSKVKAIPEGCHTVTPYLVIKGADKALQFYQQAFGAKELFRMPGPDGKIMHGEMQIGDSRVMFAEENPQWGSQGPQTLGGSPVTIFLYVPDVDATFKQAVAAGAKEVLPVADMFWGDRYGKLVDPFGHKWDIATHKEDVAPAEMQERMKKAFAAGC